MTKKENKILKVFHIIDHLPNYHPVWGGAEKSAIRRINILVDLGENIENVVAATKPQREVKEEFKFVRIVTLEDFFPQKLHLYITGFKNQIFPFDPISFLSTFLLILKVKPTVVHLHKANKISFAPIVVCCILRIPIVLSISDYWYFCPSADLVDMEGNICTKFQGRWCASCSATEKFGFVRKFAYLFRRPIFDFFFSKISAFRVSSRASRELISRYGISKEKLVIVRQAYNSEAEKIIGKSKKNTIYLNAWMAPHKGVHVAVAAMAEVVKKIPRAKLKIDTKVFDKKYELKILKMIKRLKLQKNITINIKPSQKVYLQNIKEAAVVLIPEQWENMGPTTLGDAMALARPVVASRIGGIPEFIKNRKSGFLVNHRNPISFANRIIELLRDHSLATRFGNQAKKDIISLGSDKRCLKGLLKLYGIAVSNQR